jgi:hypothetical protein
MSDSYPLEGYGYVQMGTLDGNCFRFSSLMLDPATFPFPATITSYRWFPFMRAIHIDHNVSIPDKAGPGVAP